MITVPHRRVPEPEKNPGHALARNLEMQTEAYRDYLVLLRDQRHALIHGAMAHLAEANAAIDGVLARLLQLDVDREAWVAAILEKAGLYRRSPTEGWFTRPAVKPSAKCEELVPHLEAEAARRLLAARDALRPLLREAQDTARINTALAENGQRLVAATLSAITSVAGRSPAERHRLYTRQGQSQLHRRQLRSLVNRKA